MQLALMEKLGEASLPPMPGFQGGTIYKTADIALYEEDCLEVMRRCPNGLFDMVFADPPYNIKKAAWDKFKSQDEYIEWSVAWIAEASRILKGTLFICGFSEILADLKRPALSFFSNCRWLVWHYKNKANLG